MALIHRITNKIVRARVNDVNPLIQRQRATEERLNGNLSVSDDEMAAAYACRENLAAFVNYTNPFACEDWQVMICERLQQLRHQTGQRIAIHAPPQLGKSIIVSQRFPAWMVGASPTHRVRLTCYNETHAERFSVVNQEIMKSPAFARVFPEEDARLPSQNRANEWSTMARRRLLDGQSSFLALGLRSGFTGQGADTLIIDDPYKGMSEAYSDTINDGIWEWWKSTATPRLNPESNVVVMFHRWRENDLAGRLIEQGGWEQMRFPALADGGLHDPTHRALGATLSRRYPVAYYEAIQKNDPFGFLCLYQGTPIQDGGNMCKLVWLRLEKEAPRSGMTYVRYWDKAGTEGGGCFSAGVLIGRDENGIFWVLDVIRGQWGAVNREEVIKQTAQMDAYTYGNVVTWCEQEPGSGGLESAENTIRNLAGFAVYSEKVGEQTGNKIARFTPFCSQAKAGNVRVLIRDWTDDFRTELCKFPAGTYKDQVDSAAGAFNKAATAVVWTFA